MHYCISTDRQPDSRARSKFCIPQHKATDPLPLSPVSVYKIFCLYPHKRLDLRFQSYILFKCRKPASFLFWGRHTSGKCATVEEKVSRSYFYELVSSHLSTNNHSLPPRQGSFMAELVWHHALSLLTGELWLTNSPHVPSASPILLVPIVLSAWPKRRNNNQKKWNSCALFYSRS